MQASLLIDLFSIVKGNFFMTTAPTFANAPDVSADSYLVIGLATCFIKEDGEVHQVKVIEPIPSAALEAILKGIPTSYQLASATTLSEVLVDETPQKLPEFGEDTQFCDDFVLRAFSAARTYKSRLEAQAHIPLGTSRKDFNYSTERKRVLNSDRLVTTEDNIKQHSHTHKVL
jgi:hypothetical protein